MRLKPATIGSVSTGTCNPSHLIPRLHDELEWQLQRQERTPENRDEIDRLHAIYGRISDECWDEDGEYIETDDDCEILVELEDALNHFAPAYCYFGSHPGDGSDVGFWISDFIEEDFDGLRVDDTSEVPGDYTGEVLHVNDHGNVTLYVANNGNLTELWGAV